LAKNEFALNLFYEPKGKLLPNKKAFIGKAFTGSLPSAVVALCRKVRQRPGRNALLLWPNQKVLLLGLGCNAPLFLLL